MEEEYSRMTKSDSAEIVIKLSDYGGKEGIDVREFVKTTRYEGWSKSGIRIPVEKWEEFKALVNQVKISE